MCFALSPLFPLFYLSLSFPFLLFLSLSSSSSFYLLLLKFFSAITAEGRWSYHYSNYTNDGKKLYYRCKAIKRSKKQCNAAVYRLFDSPSDNVIIYRTENVHEHDINNMSKEAFPTFLKSEINKMCDLLMKPKRILRNLADNGHQIQIKQLQNYITAYKKKKYGSTSISLCK